MSGRNNSLTQIPFETRTASANKKDLIPTKKTSHGTAPHDPPCGPFRSPNFFLFYTSLLRRSLFLVASFARAHCFRSRSRAVASLFNWIPLSLEWRSLSIFPNVTPWWSPRRRQAIGLEPRAVGPVFSAGKRWRYRQRRRPRLRD